MNYLNEQHVHSSHQVKLVVLFELKISQKKRLRNGLCTFWADETLTTCAVLMYLFNLISKFEWSSTNIKKKKSLFFLLKVEIFQTLISKFRYFARHISTKPLWYRGNYWWFMTSLRNKQANYLQTRRKPHFVKSIIIAIICSRTIWWKKIGLYFTLISMSLTAAWQSAKPLCIIRLL